MTPWSQIISTVIFTIGVPICVGVAIVIARNFSQRLPEQQRKALEQFARLAVQQVEQQYQVNPSKKDLAQASIATLFKAFKLPIPPPEVIDIAIESAVHALPSSNNPPKTNA